MALSLPFNTRYSASRKPEATQQLIIFCIRQEWFALPIHFAQKVIPMNQVQGAIRGKEIGLAFYGDQELMVIDIERRIFREPIDHQNLPDIEKSNSASQLSKDDSQQHLLIVQNSQRELVGLILNDQPTLRRVPESTLTSVPDTYRTEGYIQCVGALVIPTQDQPPLFLLDLNQLIQLQSPLLPEGL